jgi:hypothetical protein
LVARRSGGAAFPIQQSRNGHGHLKDDMASAFSRVTEEISGHFAFGRSHRKFREAILAAMHEMQKIAAVESKILYYFVMESITRKALGFKLIK